MINITIVQIKKNITTIEATGHSGYAEAGNDIVCSAVSTLMQALAVGLTEVVKVSADVKIDETIPYMNICLNENITNTNVQTLMQTTMLSLKQVANEFTKHIKIKEKQV